MNKKDSSGAPKWNLSSIYESFDGDDFKKDMEDIYKLIKKRDKLK